MNDESQAIQTVNNDTAARRTFLRNSLLVAVPVVMGGSAFSAVAASYTPPVRNRGSAKIYVRRIGAKGDGVTDETAVFQRAIDSLPASGGTVYVAPGTYLIDAVRSVHLRSNMHFEMSSGAKLIAKPNSAGNSNVLYADNVHDVEISGGQIIGERDEHRGTTGEWGHGIRIRGSERVTIRDIRIAKCWGDGITVGPKPVWRAPYILSREVSICNVVCTGNRRQGLSIGNVRHIEVYNSEFSDTHGTAPECGIDVEPDGGGIAYDVRIENCLLRGNAKHGLLLWRGAKGVQIKKNTFENNKVCGIATVGAIAVFISGNTVRGSGSTGVAIKRGTDNCQLSGNTFSNNYMKQGLNPRADFTMTGWSREIQKDVLISDDTHDIRLTRNYYR